MSRSTHTYVLMDLSPASYAEIKAKMVEAGYDHVFDGDVIDMHGIAVQPAPQRDDVEILPDGTLVGRADRIADLQTFCQERGRLIG